jgi:hypothetical protein
MQVLQSANRIAQNFPEERTEAVIQALTLPTRVQKLLCAGHCSTYCDYHVESYACRRWAVVCRVVMSDVPHVW